MSKFVEKLEKIGKSRPQSIGFTHFVSATKPLNMAVAGSLSSLDPSLAERAAKAGVDAVLLRTADKAKANALKGFIAALGDVPLGCTISSGQESAPIDGERIDFELIKGLDVPAESLAEAGEKVGALLSVELAWPDSFLRAADQLPVNALFLDLSQSGPLNLEVIINCRRLSLLTQKPILAAIPLSWGSKALPVLRDAGVKAVMVDLEEAEAGALEELCNEARNLGPAKSKPMKLEAMLPAVSAGIHEEEEEEEEEE